MLTKNYKIQYADKKNNRLIIHNYITTKDVGK